MSFSAKVKEELNGIIPSSRHCQLAELAAIIHFGGKICKGEDGKHFIQLQTENESILRKYFTLLRKAYIIDTDVDRLLYAIKLMEDDKLVRTTADEMNPILIKNSCCRRSYLRGAFMLIGSMSDPRKGYHLEFVCNEAVQAEQLMEVLCSFGLDAKTVIRKKYKVVYVKESSGIVDLLNVMGAHLSLMELENLRIKKEVSNSVNRKVNCEAANIIKTVNAASRQIEDIKFLYAKKALSGLPDNLLEMAEIRLQYPDASLKELGGYLNPPVGKSGVNHRLRKLSELAQKLKEEKQ